MKHHHMVKSKKSTKSLHPNSHGPTLQQVRPFFDSLKGSSVAEPSLFWFGSGLINSRRRIRLRLSAQAVIQYYKIK